MKELFLLLTGGFLGFINGVFLIWTIEIEKGEKDNERKDQKNK